MKRCPECRRDYYDETLLYCLDDGSALLDGPASLDEPTTAILHSTDDPAEASTRAQIHTTGQTAVPANSTELPVTKNTSRRIAIIAGVIGVLIVTALGIGGYWLYGRVGAKQIESIAVMPFVNDSGNSDVEYLSDGMTETLIRSLSHLPNLAVKSRSAVFYYKGKETSPKTIGEELGVQAVLLGRVGGHGDDLKLNLELVNTQTQDVIWTEQYDRKQSDLVSLQSEITRDVSSKLKLKLSGEDEAKVTKPSTVNPEAYQAYLKGRYYWNRRTAENNKKAIEYFEQAIAIDNNFALAYSGLADCLYLVPLFDPSYVQAEWNQRAKAAANKAVEIDKGLAEPHVVLAALLFGEWKFEEAEREYKTAIEMDPGYAAAHQWYAEFLSLMGRHDEAIAEIRKALELDPVSLVINTEVGVMYLRARQYDMAIEQVRRTVEMDPGFVLAHQLLGEAYGLKGMAEEYANETEKADILAGKPPEEVKQRYDAMRNAFRTAGMQGFWRKEIEFLLREHSLNVLWIAGVYAQINEKDKAFEILEKQYENHDPNLTALKESPYFDPLHDDPRYQDLIRRIGFPK